jgi:iron(III) transport system permease protein
VILGGNFSVLSTEIYFSIVGAQLDEARGATFAFVLLAFALAAFGAQRFLLRRRSFVTVGGKGDGGSHPPLPSVARRVALASPCPGLRSPSRSTRSRWSGASQRRGDATTRRRSATSSRRSR